MVKTRGCVFDTMLAQFPWKISYRYSQELCQFPRMETVRLTNDKLFLVGRPSPKTCLQND